MILLVRHGETEGNRTKILQLPSTPLNSSGHEQAKRAGQRIAQEWKVYKIIASDLERTQNTANAISSATRVPVQLHPLLQERDFGDLRGKPYGEVFSQSIDLFSETYFPPKGESIGMFQSRIADAWEMILEHAKEVPHQQVLVVVTHGMVLDHISKTYLDVDPQIRQLQIIPFRNTSLSLVDPSPGHNSFHKIISGIFNDDTHIPPEESKSLL